MIIIQGNKNQKIFKNRKWIFCGFSFATSRCATCIGESARAQWFRHSDGWRSGSSTLGSGSGQGILTSQGSTGGHKRSPWDSLPSLRQDSSLNDSGYKSTRADSFEQRFVKFGCSKRLDQ